MDVLARLTVVAQAASIADNITGVEVAAEEVQPATGSHISSPAGITRSQTARQWGSSMPTSY